VTIDKLVLFGATGDLARRFIFPALAQLSEAGRLPDGFRMFGAAHDEMSESAFRRLIAESLDLHAEAVPIATRERIVRSLHYAIVDLADAASVARTIESGDKRPVAVYLALPPRLFPITVNTLGAVGLPRGSRIAIEKPFGNDLDAAIRLNALLAEVTGSEGEQAVFRVDHVLGMPTVQNLLRARFANRVLGSVWNGTHVEEIEILWEETLTLEGRAGYYDRAGALLDVIQNHVLQLLCLVAMEAPSTWSTDDVRDRKAEVLRAVRPLTHDDIVRRTRRARYGAGTVVSASGDEIAVPRYADEEGVDARRSTETFAELELEVDLPRWAGTRFVLRAGKALRERRKCVVVRFRRSPPFIEAPHTGFEEKLEIGIDGPETITLQRAGGTIAPQADVSLALRGHLPAAPLSPYANVLAQILEGGSDLSVRGDEAELAWRIVTPVLRAWVDDAVPLLEYPAGSDGPVSPRDDR
jgi:glucose-6-phosphate 1-dehydrogenase